MTQTNKCPRGYKTVEGSGICPQLVTSDRVEEVGIGGAVIETCAGDCRQIIAEMLDRMNFGDTLGDQETPTCPYYKAPEKPKGLGKDGRTFEAVKA